MADEEEEEEVVPHLDAAASGCSDRCFPPQREPPRQRERTRTEVDSAAKGNRVAGWVTELIYSQANTSCLGGEGALPLT